MNCFSRGRELGWLATGVSSRSSPRSIFTLDKDPMTSRDNRGTAGPGRREGLEQIKSAEFHARPYTRRVSEPPTEEYAQGSGKMSNTTARFDEY